MMLMCREIQTGIPGSICIPEVQLPLNFPKLHEITSYQQIFYFDNLFGIGFWYFQPGLPWWLSQESTHQCQRSVFEPGSGRSPGEGNGNPLQYSLIAQLVKNPPAMQETPVRFLSWEDLEKGKTTHSSTLS